MKVSFVTRNLSAGGAERVIAQLATYMAEKGIHCEIVTIDQKEVFYTIPSNIKIYQIGKKSNNKVADKFLRYKDLRRYLKLSNPNVVLSMPEEIGIYVIPALLGTGIPIVVSERNNPWVMPWKKVTRLLRRIFYPFADGFVFQTKQAASFFPKSIRQKGIILPNPLDLNRIPEPWNGERNKEIIGVGRLEPQKNFPLLIKAFAKFYSSHPDYKLTIYGEGSKRNELESLASSLLPKSAYSFPGRNKDLLNHIKKAKMFVLSSDYEGMPNVLIEAMAMGMPVIATDCPSGGPAELINNGKNGLLVPVNDIDKMAEAMVKIADSEEFAKTLGENAVFIKNKLDSEVISENWMTFLCKFGEKSRVVREKRGT